MTVTRHDPVRRPAVCVVYSVLKDLQFSAHSWLAEPSRRRGPLWGLQRAGSIFSTPAAGTSHGYCSIPFLSAYLALGQPKKNRSSTTAGHDSPHSGRASSSTFDSCVLPLIVFGSTVVHSRAPILFPRLFPPKTETLGHSYFAEEASGQSRKACRLSNLPPARPPLQGPTSSPREKARRRGERMST